MAAKYDAGFGRTDLFYWLAIVAILVFAFSLSVSFYYGPSPANGFDNYLYTDFGYYISVGDFRAVTHWGFPHFGALAQRYILSFGIAFFDRILPVGRLSASMFGILCFLLTILLLYKMGGAIHSRSAGLFAAFFYSFIPMAVINASYVGDNGPMALFAVLSIYLLILSLKAKGGRRYWYIAASGFIGLIGILTTIEEILVLLVPGIVSLAYLVRERDRESVLRIGCLAAGVGIAAGAILVISTAAGLGPFYILSLNVNTYGHSPIPTQPTLNSYMGYIFPYSAVDKLVTVVQMLEAHARLGSVFSLVYRWLFNASAFNYAVYQTVGLFGYATVLAAIYLISKRDKRIWLPAVWIFATLLYLGYGTSSLTHYLPIGWKSPRYSLLFLPAFALIMGMAGATAIDSVSWRRILHSTKRRKGGTSTHIMAGYIAVGFLALLTILLLANSILAINFISMSEYEWVYPLIKIAGVINTLPGNASLYEVNMLPLEYTNFSHRAVFVTTLSCESIPPGSYVVTDYNASLSSECDLVPLFTPGIPAYLKKYDLASTSGFANATSMGFNNYTRATLYFHP